MEIKSNKQLKINRYFLGVMGLIIVFQMMAVGARIIRKESSWTDVASLGMQSCWFAICLKVHLIAQKKQEDTYKEYITKEYASQQILNQCQKCQHYQGQIHGGNLLVCVLHPYGQEDCQDYE